MEGARRKEVMLERITELTPAYDKTDPDPAKNYGVHGVELRMILKDSEGKGAVQFVLYTNWHLPHVQQRFDQNMMDKPELIQLRCFYHPMPADRGFHSPYSMYEGHDYAVDSCPYLNGAPCYYDGSGLNAEDVYHILVEKGSDGVWEHLEEYWHHLFDKEEVHNEKAPAKDSDQAEASAVQEDKEAQD